MAIGKSDITGYSAKGLATNDANTIDADYHTISVKYHTSAAGRHSEVNLVELVLWVGFGLAFCYGIVRIALLTFA